MDNTPAPSSSLPPPSSIPLAAPPVLDLVFFVQLELAEPIQFGPTPAGKRAFWSIKGGYFQGFGEASAMRGKVLPVGGDWAYVSASNDLLMNIDTRAVLVNHDDAFISMNYLGKFILNDKALGAIAGAEPMAFGDSYFFTNPVFETGDPRYSWLNLAVTVGQGRLFNNAGSVEYRVYKVSNG